MLVTKELIQRFFDNKCTKEEAGKVADHLEKNPHVLNEYIRQDWNGAEDDAALPAGVSEAMLREIRAVVFPGAITRKLGRGVWWAAAAVLIVTGGAVLLSRVNDRHVTVARQQPALGKDTMMTQVSGVYKVLHNNSHAAQRMLLPDGSEVVLSANSTLRYREPFTDSARSVGLEGEARFTVVKHEGQPFSVTAGPIRTLVLGTVFTMSENVAGVTVKLHSGKVKVQSVMTALKGWRKDLIMTPGEVMMYSGTDGLVTLSAPMKATPAADHKESLVFHHIPLSKVLDQLAARYHKSIEYDSQEISDLSFSGTVLPTDTLLTMLQEITHMNDLMVEESNRGYLIRKKLP